MVQNIGGGIVSIRLACLYSNTKMYLFNQISSTLLLTVISVANTWSLTGRLTSPAHRWNAYTIELHGALS